jgi:hypothetical protein
MLPWTHASFPVPFSGDTDGANATGQISSPSDSGCSHQGSASGGEIRTEGEGGRACGGAG